MAGLLQDMAKGFVFQEVDTKSGSFSFEIKNEIKIKLIYI